MKTYYYYKAIRRTIIQFLDLFNEINIVRYARDGSTVSKYVEVPLRFAGKEKTWEWIHRRKDDEMLPMISVSLTSVEFATERVGNRYNNVVKSTTPGDGEMQRFPNPIPYNLSFSLSVWTLHMSDADQILEQILPYFDPYVVMKVGISELDAEFDVKVIFQSCAPDISIEMPDEERRVVMWNMDFMVHTYLFKPISEPSIIKKIITKIYTDEEQWGNRGTYRDGSTETTFTSGASGYEAAALQIKAVTSDGEWYDSDGDPYYEYNIWE